MKKQKLLYSGKAKSLYETDDPNLLINEFRDDTTAFDGEKKAALANKGATNAKISNMLMQHLELAGIPTHYVETLSDTEVVVKKLTMLPIECVVRNIAAGSLCRRLGIEPKRKLTPPIFEFFLKDDALHDPLINKSEAITLGWATAEQLDAMESMTLKIHAILTKLFDEVDLILVDAKYEFGLCNDELILGDEISPDSCRLWDKTTGEPYDKDRFRQDLGGVIERYQAVLERLVEHK